MKTVKFYTLGCKVNQHDTQSIRERFLDHGYKEIDNGKVAGLCVINTCTVTAKADRDSKSVIRNCRKNNPQAKIIVTGCLAAKDSVSSLNFKEIDFIISKKFFPEGISGFLKHSRAFLKIQDGCDNFCSYCKVPLVRGVSRSRPLEEIVQEARKLVKNGFKEIVLTGICLGAYGRDLIPRINLVDVINLIEKVEGLLRLRLSSIEVKDVSDELIETIAGSKKICRHLHIPLQSGDNQVLKIMNRRYCREEYLELIEKIKFRIFGMAITTDCLVGFPGESEKNFKNTLDLISKILPLKVHIFPYSRREGTFSARNLSEKITPFIMKERVARLERVSGECAVIYKKQFLNKDMEALIEERSKENPCYWIGYTGNYIKVKVKSKENLKNRLISLRLKKICGEVIFAELIKVLC